MKLPIENQVDKYIDILTNPDEHNLNNQMIENIQHKIDKLDENDTNNLVKGKLLLAQALIHYQKNDDEKALSFANASIKQGLDIPQLTNLIESIKIDSKTSEYNEDDIRSIRSAFDFSYYISNSFKNYFNFRGRARRAEFWWFYLLYWIITGLMYTSNEFIVLFAGLAFFAIIIPMIALIVRRIHDQNTTGWAVLLFFIPLVGLILFLVYTLTDGDKDTNRFGNNPKFQ